RRVGAESFRPPPPRAAAERPTSSGPPTVSRGRSLQGTPPPRPGGQSRENPAARERGGLRRFLARTGLGRRSRLESGRGGRPPTGFRRRVGGWPRRRLRRGAR